MQPEVSANDEPLVHKGFEYERRKYHDVCFTVFYAVLMTFCGGVGVFALINKNEHWDQLYKKDYVDDERFCAGDFAPDTNITSAEIKAALESFKNREDVGAFLNFLKHSWPWLAGSAGGAVLLGFVFLLLFSYFAIGMVYMTVVVIVMVPLGAGVYYMIAEQFIVGGIILAVTLILILVFMCLRTKLNMVAKVLDIGADGVRENLQLIGFALGTVLTALVVLGVLGFVGAIGATNGHFERNPKATNYIKGSGCFSLVKGQAQCCEWNADNWLPGFYTLLAFMALWNIFLVAQIRAFVVSGVVGQWYFAGEGDVKVHGKTRRSLRHALGPSFGSICLSSILITIGRILRAAAERMQRKNKKSWFWYLVNCCAQAILSMLEWITDLATVHMAITGESFWESGKDTVEMLKRNFINAYVVWWIGPIVLGLTGFILAGTTSSIVGYAAYITWKDDDGVEGLAKKWSIYLALITVAMILLVLLFFSTILLDSVSAAFVCFAIDRDNRQETRSKIHEVLGLMPSVGIQSDGKGEKRDRSYAYDAPDIVTI